ncbi:Mur ligase family protein [Herpetosiphon giganteus]|uniref:Mur ligase family protein n=1 Tax=Herpetosiphon giganteus TaxID=2029754 RepID=UPI00195B7043|nr:Mur ligase family protein [Herpetosiphon giganteus]MBM7843074.1 UDP-N-acetylmuramyl tripeptide synthase [Herpetosiphon giganteus]
MLEFRDIRALEGPNGYAHAPVALVRLVGNLAEIQVWLDQVAYALSSTDIKAAEPVIQQHPSLGEFAITWATTTPESLALLLEQVAGTAEAASTAEIQAMLAREQVPSTLQPLREQHLPVWRADDRWLVGYGVHSQNAAQFDQTTYQALPIIAISGTNGKTTTTRLIDFTLRTAGYQTGRTDTDGVWINNQAIEHGDWTGFGGAQLVLSQPTVEVAVLETARGGLLRRGIAFDHCDIAVLTNVADDHLPDRGLATVAEMAHFKATIVRAAQKAVILNADDQVLIEVVAPQAPAPIIWFSLQANNPLILQAQQAQHSCLFLAADQLMLASAGHIQPLIAVAELPLSFGGVAQHNIANALAAAAALHAFGLSAGQIALGLAGFRPNAEHNPGRLNQFQRDGITLLIDYAHNSDGLRVLLASAEPLSAADGQIAMVFSGTGDRTDQQIQEQMTIIAQHVDRLVIKRDPWFLRGREPGTLEPLMIAAASAAGLDPSAITELEGDDNAFAELTKDAKPGDVLLWLVYKDRLSKIAMAQAWERAE